MRWKNLWRHKPPVNKNVLLWIPGLSGKGGDMIISCPRVRAPGSRKIWWIFGNTVMWQPLPRPPKGKVG